MKLSKKIVNLAKDNKTKINLIEVIPFLEKQKFNKKDQNIIVIKENKIKLIKKVKIGKEFQEIETFICNTDFLFEVGFNANYLKEVICNNDFQGEALLKNSIGAVKFKNKNGLALIMPIRI